MYEGTSVSTIWYEGKIPFPDWMQTGWTGTLRTPYIASYCHYIFKDIFIYV